jgi:hypothetical protein
LAATGALLDRPAPADAVAAPPSSSSSSGPSGPSGSGGPPPDEFHLNFGEAVAVLREDLPALFDRELRWHIYRDDVVFTLGSIPGGRLTGVEKYKWLHRGARALAWLLYSDVRVGTLRLWQPQADGRQLRVRWSVTARPRLPFLFGGGGEGGSGSGSADAPRFEAISTYKFDSKGRIYEHAVDRIIPPEAPLARWLEAFVNWHGAPAAAQQPAGVPVPGGGGGAWRDQL